MISPGSDHLCHVQIAGAAARTHGWRITAAEEAWTIAELRKAAAERADPLAGRAGMAHGLADTSATSPVSKEDG